ncbi:hypothetical protein E1218_22710 [Kribbella turkmenica]|uniref:Uncharacterized protein n=1 Tax=Kribbella turkmenica TaxID=2530375 RepID=A0A4R4WRJ7_9ACTN|nr:hypothetical protein [Kribbella turkmenica]TDD20325.1 hypothetical protein E1218_22710 [Kribbella turkmenica]
MVAHRAEVVGVLDVPQLHAFGVAAVELGFDVFGDVDAVDDQVADPSGDVDVDQAPVDGPGPGQVTVDEPRVPQVRHHERRPTKSVIRTVVSRRPPERPELR